MELVPRELGSARPALDLPRVLARLAEAQMNEVHVEAGPTLAGALIRSGLADELLIYAAPVLLGPQGRPLADLPRIEALEDAPRFDIIESVSIGPDLRVRLRPRAPGADARHE